MKKALLLSFLLLACSKKADNSAAKGSAAAEKPASGGTVYTCFDQIAAKAETFEGTSSGPDEKKAEAEAWATACAKLPAADQPNCHDASKFDVAQSGGSAGAGGKTTYTKTIKLTSHVETVQAEAKSNVSSDEACKAARVDACKKAGAEGDCVAGGKFEQKGHGTGTESSK